MSREAMQLALGALELYQSRMSVQRFDEAVKALRQALETEPFEYWNAVEGWVKIDEVREHFDSVGCGTIYKSAGEGRSPLYTAPPKAAEWVGLTDEEVMVAAWKAGFDIHEDYDNDDDPEAMHWWSADGEVCDDSLLKLRDLIEAKLKEKNHG
jgi:hypothetical protein